MNFPEISNLGRSARKDDLSILALLARQRGPGGVGEVAGGVGGAVGDKART